MRAGCNISLDGSEADCVIVKPDVAQVQMEADHVLIGLTPDSAVTGSGPSTETAKGTGTETESGTASPTIMPPTRYYGTVDLDPARVIRDAGQIADEVITHFTSIAGTKVRMTLEIEAEIPGGADENLQRTVTENSRTLKFTNDGFECE